MRFRIKCIILFVTILAMPSLFLATAWKVASNFRGMQPGDTLPPARLLTLNGEAVWTTDWRGQPTLLVLYQSTCSACRKEVLDMLRIKRQFPDVQIRLVSLDSAAFDFEVPFPAYRDPNGDFLKRTRRLAVPTVYGINAEGKVVLARVGLLSLSDLQHILKGARQWETGRERHDN